MHSIQQPPGALQQHCHQFKIGNPTTRCKKSHGRAKFRIHKSISKRNVRTLTSGNQWQHVTRLPYTHVRKPQRFHFDHINPKQFFYSHVIHSGRLQLCGGCFAKECIQPQCSSQRLCCRFQIPSASAPVVAVV